MKNDRAISLKTALDAADSIIERDTSGNNDVVKVMTAWKEYINALPSAQPGWIPCTPETMPQESDEYLVTVKWGEGDCDVDIYEYNAYHKEWNDGELYGAMVIAWQPKLEPWEGDANG